MAAVGTRAEDGTIADEISESGSNMRRISGIRSSARAGVHHLLGHCGLEFGKQRTLEGPVTAIVPEKVHRKIDHILLRASGRRLVGPRKDARQFVFAQGNSSLIKGLGRNEGSFSTLRGVPADCWTNYGLSIGHRKEIKLIRRQG